MLLCRMENKTHWKKLTNPNYLGAYSLDNKKEMSITIKHVAREMVKGTGGKEEECTVAHMVNGKPMILNNTNCKVIEKIYGTPFIDDWKNKKITIYIANIRAFGEDVKALRIKPEAPPLPKITKELYNEAKKALDNGTTFNQMRTKYQITKEQQDEIENL